jgi:hypothetical protein
MDTDAAPSAPRTEDTEDTRLVGRVASPPQREATSEQFHFWVPTGQVVEKTQIVRATSKVGGEELEFFALVDEVYRQSRKRHIGQEYDAYDGDAGASPPFSGDGLTYASATILRTAPMVLTPPLEESPVYLGSRREAHLAYGADEIEPARQLPIGLVKNGGSQVAGPGVIDLDYLLGQNGGHLNVNGVAGRGTKSSFLLFSIAMLLHKARRQAEREPSAAYPLLVVPIILNVKGFDLFHIDRWSRPFMKKAEVQRALWAQLGVPDPRPFTGATFYAPQEPGSTLAIATGCEGEVQPYSWGLRDIVEGGLLSYLFAEEDTADDNFNALLLDLEGLLAREIVADDGTLRRVLRNDEGQPQTFHELLGFIEREATSKDDARRLRGHHTGTWGKLRRRLLNLVLGGRGVLRRSEREGRPLRLTARETRDPVVVDINGLSGAPALQRFVVAAILEQLIASRRGPSAVSGLSYLVALDELNRFAPHGARDAITRRIELVAAEMRSQGIILLGAQQQASRVSEKVIENASIRALGRSGSLELRQPLWRFLGESARRKAESLPVDEKLVLQDSFRAPMHVRVPLPPWAMRREEIWRGPGPDGDAGLAGRDEIEIY